MDVGLSVCIILTGIPVGLVVVMPKLPVGLSVVGLSVSKVRIGIPVGLVVVLVSDPVVGEPVIGIVGSFSHS